MKACTGPCNQGRTNCPCPQSCELAESDPWPFRGRDGLVVLVILMFAVACIATA